MNREAATRLVRLTTNYASRAESAPGGTAAEDELVKEALLAEKLRVELADWQFTRDAFLAKHESKRRRRALAISDGPAPES